MKNVKYLLFAAVMFCIGKAGAQVATLGLDSGSLAGLPAVDTINHSYAFFVTVIDTSSTPFVGVLSIGGKVNGIYSDGNTPGGAIYYTGSGVNDSVPARSAVSRLVIITVSNPPFIAGSSGVVIWPIAVSGQNQIPVHILDSLSTTVTIVATGINELTERNLKVYMAGKQLVVQNNGGYLLKKVNVYDGIGNLLREQPMSESGSVNMEGYAQGVYFAEIVFADDTRAAVKVVNTR